MNPVSVSPTITAYEAARQEPSFFQETSRFIEEKFSSVPPILEPSYEDFLEKFLTKTRLYIKKKTRHSPEEQIDLLSFVLQLVLSHTATYQKTLDPIVYADVKRFLLNSLTPLCRKIATLQKDLTKPYLNRSLLKNLKVEAPLLFSSIMSGADQYGALPGHITLKQFDKAVEIYERCFSIRVNESTDSDSISPQKHLSTTYLSWIATLLNVLKKPTPRSMNALKGPLLEFSSLFLRSSLLDLYQVKSKDPSNTSPPFILSQKIESLNWNNFFNALEFRSKPFSSENPLPSPLVTRYQEKNSPSLNAFYDSEYLKNHIYLFNERKIGIISVCMATPLKYFFEIMNGKYDISNRVILFIAQKIDKKNTKVSPIPFPLKNQETLSNLRASLVAFFSLPHPPFLLIELVNLLDWLLEEGFSARHYPFLLHTFHRIMEYSILNMLQTCFPNRAGDPFQNIQDYFPVLRETISEGLVNSLNDLIMGESLDSFITSHPSRGSEEILEAIKLSERSLTPEEHEQIASQFVTQIEPLIRVLIELTTSLRPYLPRKSLPPRSSKLSFIRSPDILEPIYREALFPTGESTPEKHLAGIYLNWAATLLTILETPTKYPAYALDGIFNESLDLFLRFSFLNFYKLTKDPQVDCRDSDTLPKPLKNHEWEDFFTVMGVPISQVRTLDRQIYTSLTRYRTYSKNLMRCGSKHRPQKKKIQLMHKHPSLYYCNIKDLFEKYIAIYLFSLQRSDEATLQAIALSKNPPHLIKIVKNIEKEHAQVPSIPFNGKDKETLNNLITSLGVFLSLQNYPFLLPDLLHLLYWLDEEGFSTRHYPFLLHAFHRIAEYAILDSLQKWFSWRNPDPSKNIEDYFPYLIDHLRRPDLADRIGALILKNDLDYFIHPEARTGAQEIMEAVHLSNLELPPEECEKVASRFIEQIKPLLDLLIELIDQLNHYEPSPLNRNPDHIAEMFPHLTKGMK